MKKYTKEEILRGRIRARQVKSGIRRNHEVNSTLERFIGK